MYPMIDLGIIKLPTYLILFLLAYVVMIIVARKIAVGYHYPKEDILNAAIYGGIGMLVGAKLMYFISRLPSIIPRLDWYIGYWRDKPLEALEFSFGGLVFYGGLIGAVAFAYIYCRRHKLPFLPLADIFTPLLPFVHGVGRIGCFMAGCCYGKEYHGLGCVQFPANELIPELDDVPRIPVQLIEAGFNFAISIVLLRLQKRGNMKRGQLLGIYIVYYTVVRFFMEIMRGDSVRGGLGAMSTSQIISIILVPIGIVLARGKWLEKRFEQYEKDIVEGDVEDEAE